MAVGLESVKRATSKTKTAAVKPLVVNDVVDVPVAELLFNEVKGCSSIKKSVKDVGVILPIVVVRTEKGLKVVDGAKRLTALKAAGATTVKAVIVNGDEKKIAAALKATDECVAKCDLPCDKAAKTEKKDDLREAKFTAVARMYCDLPTYLL